MEQDVRIELAPDDLAEEDTPPVAGTVDSLHDLEGRQQTEPQVRRQARGPVLQVETVTGLGVAVHRSVQPTIQAIPSSAFTGIGQQVQRGRGTLAPMRQQICQ